MSRSSRHIDKNDAGALPVRRTSWATSWIRVFLRELQRWQNLTSAMIALAAAMWAWQYTQRQIEISRDQLALANAQARNAQEQLAITAKQAESAQRQLALMERDQRPIMDMNQKELPYQSDTKKISWNWEIRNIGKSTATAVGWEAFLKIGDGLFRRVVHYEPDETDPFPPGVDRWFTASSESVFGPRDFTRLKEIGGAIQLYIKVRYTDAGGNAYAGARCLANNGNGTVGVVAVRECEAKVAR